MPTSAPAEACQAVRLAQPGCYYRRRRNLLRREARWLLPHKNLTLAATSWAGATSRTTTSSSRRRAINEDIVREMSWMKGEPEWMTERRLKALRLLPAPAHADLGR